MRMVAFEAIANVLSLLLQGGILHQPFGVGTLARY
jgi:hypothetical protein